jgi:cathepsin B
MGTTEGNYSNLDCNLYGIKGNNRRVVIMKLNLIILLLGCVLGDRLITVKRAKELRNSVDWRVANPKKNPLRRFSLEKFQARMRGNSPITHEAAKELQSFFPDKTLQEIKFLVESKAPISGPKISLEETIAGEETIKKEESRNLQSDNWWEEDDDWEDDGIWEYEDYIQPNTNDNSTNSTQEEEFDAAGLPVNFDGRKLWGKCIHSGRDQKECNGCWAFGITNHMSDRFCIWGKDVVLSVQDLLECTPNNTCCTGGSASFGYKFLTEVGVVAENCKEFAGECGSCRESNCTRYKCQKDSLFWADKVADAKWEIYNNGPIEAVFDVYDDLAYYARGVYYKTSEKLLGIHAVTVLGWGVEDGKDYWLCKNSWGDTWGDSSFFKIKMGECGINDALTT